MDRRVKPIAANNNENNKPTSPTLESAGAGGDDCDKGGIADTSAKVSAAKGQNDSESAVSSTSSDNGKGDGGDISSASVEPKRAPRKISSFILSAPHVVSSVPGSAKKIVDKSAKKVKRLAEKTGTVSVLADFRDFISRGNVIDLAVALVMGSAFTAIVNSLVKDIINPLIALGMPANTFGGYSVIRPGGSGNWSYISLQAAQADGALVENWGAFLQAIVNFLIVGASMFILVRFINKLIRRAKPVNNERDCQFCMKSISKKATRCPFCTSIIEPELTTPENAIKP